MSPKEWLDLVGNDDERNTNVVDTNTVDTNIVDMNTVDTNTVDMKTVMLSLSLFQTNISAFWNKISECDRIFSVTCLSMTTSRQMTKQRHDCKFSW